MISKSSFLGFMGAFFLIVLNHFLNIRVELGGFHLHHFIIAAIGLVAALSIRHRAISNFLWSLFLGLFFDDLKDLLSAEPIYWTITFALVLLAIGSAILINKTTPEDWFYEERQPAI
ncbi:MAG: hypothetical protein ACXQS5_03385 [Candidatus Methanospirareceae archaeon]